MVERWVDIDEMGFWEVVFSSAMIGGKDSSSDLSMNPARLLVSFPEVVSSDLRGFISSLSSGFRKPACLQLVRAPSPLHCSASHTPCACVLRSHLLLSSSSVQFRSACAE